MGPQPAACEGEPDLFARFAAALDRGGARTLGGPWAPWPPGEIVRPLGPDVAYLAFAAVGAEAPPEDVEIPLGAPTVAVEVLSPDDRWTDLADKIATYLRAGTALVLVVDPHAQTLAAYDRNARILSRGERFEHAALPGFELDLEALFAQITCD